MTQFNESAEAEVFIASADSRETSKVVMIAIAFFARDIAEAESLWDGSAIGVVASISDVWENATSNGARDDAEIMWGGRSLAEIMAENA